MTAIRRLILLAPLVLALAACQNSEERAEEHYRNALELLEQGDLDRATVEFRNVFQLDGTHTEARRTYAAAIRAAGRTQEAYSQYLRLAEQLPDDPEARIALAEMAVEAQDWEQARLHGARAVELAPDDPRAAVIGIALDYFAAIEAGDATARREAADRAASLAAEAPENIVLRRLMIDTALRDGDTGAAMAIIDEMIALRPADRGLYDVRLALLAQDEDQDGVEAQLREMTRLFPEDETVTAMLLRFFVAEGDTDAAEDFLRERIAAGTGDTDAHRQALIEILLRARGPEAALAELDGLAGTEADGIFYRTLAATIRFDTGERETAVADLQALIDGNPPSAARNTARVTLAEMLLRTGNPVGARRLVGEVLEEDAEQVDALKLQAGWLIDGDQADAAIGLLRTALQAAPGDAEAMTLMARAHQRNGNHDLTREFLSLAVEASGSAPEESLRYAAFLQEEERFILAEEVLIDALRLSPGNMDLLTPLGRLYLVMEDWPRAEQVERSLRSLGTADAEARADEMQVSRLAAQGRTEDAIAFLETLAGESEDRDIGVRIAVVRARLAAGDTEAALSEARTLAEDNPDTPLLVFTLGLTESAAGNHAAAEAAFREVLAIDDTAERVWIELIRALYAQGRIDEAEAAMEEGLSVLPGGINLLWAQAGFRERRGDIEGAIAIYEELYQRASDSLVVANNLASLLSSYRDDEETLERAWTIARRLRGTDVPAFQDTYGWIAFRRGEVEQARDYLADAAAGLPDDPLVRFHYGMALAALEENEAALREFTRAVDIAGPDDPRDQFETARAEIARLEALLASDDAVDDGAGDGASDGADDDAAGDGAGGTDGAGE
ncbi:tetratricopeptide repeat protein [Rhodobacterales bacterium HKCCE2091]|nr:tetratricopeptide repeat protein [Rhodobacterales bacterium HKCCE2091]